MILQKERGTISLNQKPSGIFTKTDGIVGLEAIQEYLGLLYPNPNDPIREKYSSAIDLATDNLSLFS